MTLASGTDTEKAERQLNDKVGSATETVWLSFILGGSSGSATNHVSLGDGLFVGRGSKDTGGSNLWLSDQDGLIDDSGISAAAQSFVVARVDFKPGDEDVWLWVDPLLDAEPDTANADANGVAKKFKNGLPARSALGHDRGDRRAALRLLLVRRPVPGAGAEHGAAARIGTRRALAPRAAAAPPLGGLRTEVSRAARLSSAPGPRKRRHGYDSGGGASSAARSRQRGSSPQASQRRAVASSAKGAPWW